MDMVAECSQPRTSYRRFVSATEDPLILVRSIEDKKSLASCRGCGSPEVKVSDYGRHVMSLSPVPLKTRRVNLSRAEMSSHWCGVVVRRGVPAQVSSRHLTMAQNYEVHRQAPSCS
ncbi:uncharacterized protein TNCV_1244521 [Trichonephila clavipes]|nr:uncharacterized protein TNCV_1244521 [Trichonephila clavipes]